MQILVVNALGAVQQLPAIECAFLLHQLLVHVDGRAHGGGHFLIVGARLGHFAGAVPLAQLRLA